MKNVFDYLLADVGGFQELEAVDAGQNVAVGIDLKDENKNSLNNFYAKRIYAHLKIFAE